MGGWIKMLIAAGIATGGSSLVPAAAQIVQRGVVLEMSSGRRPVSGVEVRAVGAAPSDSDMEGRFELDFPASLPGDPLFLDRIHKQGFELVNRERSTGGICPPMRFWRWCWVVRRSLTPCGNAIIGSACRPWRRPTGSR